MKKLILSLLLISSLSSCISRVEKHGYAFDLLSDQDLLQEGVVAKDKVLSVMGSPTLVSDLDDDEAWIYYSEDVKKVLFFKPDVIVRNLVVVRFDNKNIIKKLQSFNLADGDHKLVFVSNYTAVEGHKAGFFKDIFSNVGQIKPQ